MKAEDYHKSLRPLEEACRLAGWACIRCPLTGGRPMILLRHLALVFKIYKIRQRRILLREFSTLPLLLVFPLLWPLRKKLYFLINHNLQWAARDPLERFGLTMLAKMGARWALFETQNFQGLENFGIPSERNLVLPHPVLERFSKPWKKEGRPIVGVAGTYRPEKGMDELIQFLKEKFAMFGILLGIPNPEAAAHLDVETVSTGSDEDYFAMIARCDVLVQNGGRDSYFYRASGPIADAAACRTAVVAPDFPILGKQVAGIGEVFHSLDLSDSESAFGYSQKKRPEGKWQNMPDAVRTAVEKVRAGEYDFAAYCSARSAKALATRLEKFTNG